MAAVTVAVFGAVPTAATKTRDDDTVDGNRVGLTSADETVNDIGGGFDDNKENVAATVPTAEPAKTVKLQSAKQHNAKLLNRLGMKRVRTNGGGSGGGPNHHRKRLASQSRSKYAPDGGKGGSDSQMFIVKLPPHSHFYDDGAAPAVRQRPQHHRAPSPHHHSHYNHQQQQPYMSLNTVPVGFVSNGKPAKVYHWNLPVIKKHAMQAARYKLATGELDQQSAAAVSAVGSKAHAPRRTLYYKPRAAGKPVKKSFVNNGKPNGFYVVSNKNAAAAAAAAPQYHKIIKAYYGSGDD